jgi:hypothetical protein
MGGVTKLPGCFAAAIFSIAIASPVLAEDKPAKSKKAETPEQAIEFLAEASKAGDAAAALGQIAEPFHDIMLYYILAEKAENDVRAALDEKFGKEKRRGFTPGVEVHLLAIRKIEILGKEKESDTRVKFSVRETFKSLQIEGDEIVETTFLAIKDADSWKVLRPFTALHLDLHDDDMTEKFNSKKGPDGKEAGFYKITFKKDLDVIGKNVQKIVEKRESAPLPELLVKEKRRLAIAEKVAADVKRDVYKTREEATKAYEEAVDRADKKGK